MVQMTEGRVSKMQADLVRAMDKPAKDRSWLMVIDADKCIGCHACVVACKAENALPPGVSYRVVQETEDGEFPEVQRYFMPTNCQQCDNPTCVEGLPKDAYTKRPDGILIFHYDKLKGKAMYQRISRNCPYTAVYHDGGGFYTEGTPKLEPYETRDAVENGDRRNRKSGAKSPVDAVRKCHFCVQRLDAKMLPACVTTCVGGAMYFGDLNDPDSHIHRVLQRRQSLRIYEEEGTLPRVVYLTGTVTTVEGCLNCHG